MIVNVSLPSVSLSAAMGTVIVAVPVAPMVAVPVKAPPVISDEEIPDSV